MDQIRLTGIRATGKHGVLDFEHERAQTFVVDATLFLDLAAAGRSDDLNDTVNYSRVAKTATRVMLAQKDDLIERAASRVAEAVLAEFPVREVTVRLKKPRAPIAGDFEYVAVEITRRAPEAVV